MQYIVQPGDTLWRIAARFFGNPQKWPIIAEDNQLINPNRILVGQRLQLRDALIVPGAMAASAAARAAAAVAQVQIGPAPQEMQYKPSVIPARGYFFVLADEVNPLRRTVVRRVMVNPVLAEELARRVGWPIPVVPNPQRFGFQPTGPESKLPPGRHATAMKPSPYSSASNSPLGSSRIWGSRFWIDVDKAQAAGATFHETDEILADLDRIAKKTVKSADALRIEQVKQLVKADAEVLVKGYVPPSAVSGAASMGIRRAVQGVQVVGFVMTAADINAAVGKSVQKQSVKPIAAEGIRQAGGWATAWAGMKLGAAGGALLGIETGPGAIVTGAVGAIVGGTAGYFGFDWIADHIDAN